MEDVDVKWGERRLRYGILVVMVTTVIGIGAAAKVCTNLGLWGALFMANLGIGHAFMWKFWLSLANQLTSGFTWEEVPEDEDEE